MLKSAQTTAAGAAGRPDRRALATAAVAALMAAFVIATTVYVRHDLLFFFSRLAEARDAQKRVGAIEVGVFEAETAHRGFVIARDPAMLSLFETAHTGVEAEAQRLESAATALPELRDAAMRFTSSVRAAFVTVEADIARWRERPDDSRRGVNATSAAQTRLEAMRAAGSDLHKAIDREIDRQRSGFSQAIAVLLGAVTLFVAGLGYIIFAQTRDLRLQTANHAQSESRASQEIAGLSDVVSRTQAALNHSHRQLELALRSARVQVFTLTPDGSVDWVSDPDSRLSGSNTAASRIEDLAAVAERLEIRGKIARALAEATPAEFEMRAPRSDRPGADWLRIDIRPQRDGNAAIGSAVDITDLKDRESRMFWLMRELSHRSKNLLAIIQAIARHTARTAPSLAAFEQRFQARLRGLAAAHDLLVDRSYASADLEALIRSQFGLEIHPAGERIAVSGPPVALRPEAAQNLAMAFHELVANAQAHGALSGPDGQVTIAWRIEADRLRIDWTEAGGPAPGRSAARGFGASLITANLPRSLDGEVRLTFEPPGAACHMALPLRRLLPEDAGTPAG